MTTACPHSWYQRYQKTIVIVGGIAVTVTGAGFDRSNVVKLDGNHTCETESVSLTEIICVLPAVSVGIGHWSGALKGGCVNGQVV